MKNVLKKLFASPVYIGLALGLVLLIVWIVQKRSNGSNVDVVAVRSAVDGREYTVQNKPDKQQAANLLAQIRAKMIRLVDYVTKTNGNGGGNNGPKAQPEDERQYGSYEERAARLAKRFDADRISEGNEDPRYTTYTLNKGDKVVFCLRARGEDDRIHDLPMMTFVAVHELAHIASVTEHHTPEFASNFAWLLRNAVACGIYTFEDFKTRPRRYCGIDVTDTPLDSSNGGLEHFIMGLLGGSKKPKGWCSRCRQ